MSLKCPTYKTPQQPIKQLTEENARLRAALVKVLQFTDAYAVAMIVKEALEGQP